MGRAVAKNLLTFALVFVLTVGTVALLSRATSAKAETAPARYSQEVRETQVPAAAAELSAELPEEEISPLLSAGAFLLALAVPGSVAFLVVRSRRREQKAGRSPIRGTVSIR